MDPLLHRAGQPLLVLRGEQRDLPDLPQVHADRVVDAGDLVHDAPGGVHHPAGLAARGWEPLGASVEGALPDIAAYIDAVPTSVERLVVVQAAGRVAGGVRLEAEAYCAWLADRTGEPVRLPTEAHWHALRDSLPPACAAELVPDVLLVPMLAFDAAGYRLGYGGGFYDRFLPKTEHTPNVGVCFTEQLLDELPTEPWDIRVQQVVSA